MKFLPRTLSIYLLLASSFLSVSDFSYGQKTQTADTARGLFFSFQIGGYVPSKVDAEYYNNASSRSYNEQKIWNEYYREQIKEELGFELDDESSFTYPYPMKYKMGVAFAFQAGYKLRRQLSVFGTLNYTSLKLENYFNIPIPDYEREKANHSENYKGIISAQEDRIIVELGLHQAFIRPKSWHPYLEGGGTFVYTKVNSHEMVIGSLHIPYDIYDAGYEVEKDVGGPSWGVFMNGGIDFPINRRFSGAIGGGIGYYSVALQESPEPHPNYIFFVRLYYL